MSGVVVVVAGEIGDMDSCWPDIENSLYAVAAAAAAALVMGQICILDLTADYVVVVAEDHCRFGHSGEVVAVVAPASVGVAAVDIAVGGYVDDDDDAADGIADGVVVVGGGADVDLLLVGGCFVDDLAGCCAKRVQQSAAVAYL